MPNNAKLAVLHARTDRDLLILIERELDRGMALAQVAATKGSPLYAHAIKAYETVTPLLSKISLGRKDRDRLEAKAKELELLLDRVPALAKVQSSTMSAG